MKPNLKLREAIDSLYKKGPATHESYTQLALQCFRENDAHQAKRLQSHMELHLYRPHDTFLQNRILHLYAKSGQVSNARQLFDKMPHKDVFSWNAMLSAYSKSGSVHNLWEVFVRMPVRDSVSYNTVISGLAGGGCVYKALAAFVRMQTDGIYATDYTYVSVLNVCAQLLDLKRGKQIHGRLAVGNLGSSNVFVWNALIDLYGKCGEVDKARLLFDRMLNKNVVSWNSMISGYVKNAKPEKCIELFSKMHALDMQPDQVTVSNVLLACFQVGKIGEAKKLFSEIGEKDKVSWTTMIAGLMQNGLEEYSLMIFGQMLLENVNLDNHTISCVISCCAKLASLNHGHLVHGKAIHVGVDNDLLVSSALVDMYSKCGITSDAWSVFCSMQTKNLISWNAMIGGYAQNGQDSKALTLYKKMLQEGLKPDNVTFVGVLSACVHAGLLEEGKRYFYSITELHRLVPTMDHYACMINLLGRYESINKAVELISAMPQVPNSLIWSTLLSVCALKNDVEIAEMAARHLFELEPLNAGPYIMLSNIYAACGRWKDVAAIRSLMKTRDVKKIAACSWIEIDDKVHKFLADDQTHPDTKSIYQELNSLIKKLHRAGFIPNTKLVLHDVGEEEKFESICYHSEKLALAFGLIKKPDGVTPIRILKNIRICGDCHAFMKFVSKEKGRHVILRDSKRYHHFSDGKCSCNDNW